MIFYLNLTINFMLTIRSQELHTNALEIEEGVSVSVCTHNLILNVCMYNVCTYIDGVSLAKYRHEGEGAFAPPHTTHQFIDLHFHFIFSQP